MHRQAGEKVYANRVKALSEEADEGCTTRIFLAAAAQCGGSADFIRQNPGGCDLGINQWPWPGKLAALPLNCQSFLHQRKEPPEGHQVIWL